MIARLDTPQPDSTQIVVVQEKRRRLAVPLVAAAAGAALLGGTTFALWSASDEFTGGDIVAGDLNIEGSAAAVFYDVSSDREDATTALPGTSESIKGHEVNSDWLIVPGDKVAAVFEATITLAGDNLVAELSLDGAGTGTRTNTGMTYTYEVYHEGTVRVTGAALPTTDDTVLLYLLAAPEGQGGDNDDEAGTPVVHAMATDTETLTVVVYGTFDADTPDRDHVNVTDTLGNLTLRLEQVRNAGAMFS